MGRTLYLSENDNALSVRRDGPSVWIERREKAGQRVPARLLGRVVIIGNVRLDAGTITLFTENDIPVVFMNRSAEEVAVAIPYNHRLPSHYEEQKVFLMSAETISRYEQWAQAKRTVIQVGTLKRLYSGIASRIRYGIGEGNYQELLADLKPRSEEKWRLAMNVITNLFRGMIIERLLKADLDPHLGVLHRRHNFGLALDFCHILGAESDLQCIQLFRSEDLDSFMELTSKGWRVTARGMRSIVHRFENRRAVLENMVEITIDEIFELMRELRA